MCGTGGRSTKSLFKRRIRCFKQGSLMHAKTIAVAMLLVLGAAAPAATTALAAQASQPNQLKIIDVKVGCGAVARPGEPVARHHPDWPSEYGAKGQKCDWSGDRVRPFTAG